MGPPQRQAGCLPQARRQTFGADPTQIQVQRALL